MAMLTRLRDVRVVRYLLASVGALAVDMGSFLALLSVGMIAAGASVFWIASHFALSRDPPRAPKDAAAPEDAVRPAALD